MRLVPILKSCPFFGDRPQIVQAPLRRNQRIELRLPTWSVRQRDGTIEVGAEVAEHEHRDQAPGQGKSPYKNGSSGTYAGLLFGHVVPIGHG